MCVWCVCVWCVCVCVCVCVYLFIYMKIWTRKQAGLLTNFRQTANSIPYLFVFTHQGEAQALITLNYHFVNLFYFSSATFVDLGCLVSFSMEGDGRRGGAAGVLCCVSMGPEVTECSASLNHPADVKQLHWFEITFVQSWISLIHLGFYPSITASHPNTSKNTNLLACEGEWDS